MGVALIVGYGPAIEEPVAWYARISRSVRLRTLPRRKVITVLKRTSRAERVASRIHRMVTYEDLGLQEVIKFLLAEYGLLDPAVHAVSPYCGNRAKQDDNWPYAVNLGATGW